MFTIDKGVPLPETSNRGKYPFAEMTPGDSFFIPDGKIDSLKSACSKWSKDHNSTMKFTARATTQIIEGGDEITGVRVWRVE